MSTKQPVLKLVFVTTIFSLALIACQPTSTATPTATNAPAPTVQDTEVPSTETPTAEPLPSGPSEGLVSIQDNEYVPALATSWTVSEDGLDYIFQLKTGAVFADGTPVNADAVVANFNRWFDPEDPAHGSDPYTAWVAAFGGFKGETDDSGKPKSSFDGAEKVDNFTVLIHLNRPFNDLLAVLAQPDFAIVSPATFKTK